jgi:polyisoprenyl-phosphate glycosyltransferase
LGAIGLHGCAMVQNSLLVVMPLFNDWDACDHLLTALDDVFAQKSLTGTVVVVDDGSAVPMPSQFAQHSFRAVRRVDVLRLRRNLGHQRAICTALAYVDHTMASEYEAVVLMDSDGEDDPRDVPRLLERFRQEKGEKIVFAERTERSESMLFRFCYMLFRILHWLLTAHGVHVGNFSMIPPARLRSLVVSPELWNHYAAAVRHCRLPQCAVPTVRGKRYAGEGRMNFVSLVIHGLSAISVFSDVVGVRLLLASMIVAIMTILGVGVVVALRFMTNLAIAGWATYTAGLLLVILLQAIVLSVIFSFIILAGRHGATFQPARDCGILIDRVDAVYATGQKDAAVESHASESHALDT